MSARWRSIALVLVGAISAIAGQRLLESRSLGTEDPPLDEMSARQDARIAEFLAMAKRHAQAAQEMALPQFYRLHAFRRLGTEGRGLVYLVPPSEGETDDPVAAAASGGAVRLPRLAVDEGARSVWREAAARLDLFLAGRVLPGRYPADSRLFLARGGGRYEPAAASAHALRGLGLVTGAVFTDVDRDGDPDLALATEWGPVRLLRNEGRLVDATDAWGLAGLTGRWNAVAAGDFDGDGRPDLVATSWGENTGSRASPERPLEVYYGDVDRNGTIEVIQARHDPRIGATVPLAGYGRLMRALPGLVDRLPTRRAYADASLEEVLGGTPASRLEAVLGGTPASRLEAVTTAHTVFLNRGARPGLRVRLIGPPANRFAIGASVRLVYGDAVGSVREIRAGSGAGSHDEPVPVLGIAEPDALTAVEVQWPGGRVERVAVTAAQREVTLRAGAPGEGSR